MNPRIGERFDHSGQGCEMNNRDRRPCCPDDQSDSFPVQQAASFEGAEPDGISPARGNAVEGYRDGVHVDSRSWRKVAIWAKFTKGSKRWLPEGVDSGGTGGQWVNLESVRVRWG